MKELLHLQDRGCIEMKFKIQAAVILLIAAVFALNGISADDSFSQGKVKVIASTLNVRNIASHGGTVVATVKRGDILQTLERSKQEAKIDGLVNYWYKVGLPKGKKGWVFGGYITFELNLESGLRWRSVNPASSEVFTGIVSPKPGSIIAGTKSGNLYSSYDSGKSWKKVVPQALGNNIGPIHKIVMKKNLIWMISSGENGGGVWKTANNGASWSQYTIEQGLPSNNVTDVFLADDGMVWAVTSAGIATSKNNGLSWQNYEIKRGIKGDPLSITVIGKNIILGTTKGIYVLVHEGNLLGGKKGKWVKAAPKQIKSKVTSIYHLDGMVYAGTDKGLVRSDASSLKEWFVIGGSSKVRSILIDQKKRILVATKNGLNISLDKGDSWVTYKKEHGLASNSISGIAVDRNNNIWVTMEKSGIAYHD